MKAIIVTIGDEILIGQVVDTNSAFMAKALDRIGIETIEMLSISDKKEAILATLAKAQNTVDVVLLTGGLGPTKDDITKKTFCDYFEDTLVEDATVLQQVKSIIEGFYKRPITQINKDQALVPSKAKVLFNAVGTAPGMWMEQENTVFISLPGVPYEMKHLIEKQVVPALINRFERPFIIHQTILTYGRGESMLAEQLEEWELNLPEFIKLAYLPSPGKVRLRLTARGKDKSILENELKKQVALLDQLIHEVIIGYDEEEVLEVVLGNLLTQKKQTLATAESCTGGKIAATLTANAGASAYFLGSVVSYATETKTTILGVSRATIENHGVVSEQVAKEMALGVQKLTGSDYAIATTGSAGPTSGSDRVALGTVFIGIASPNEVYAREFNFGQPREKVVNRTVNQALELLYKEILKK